MQIAVRQMPVLIMPLIVLIQLAAVAQRRKKLALKQIK
jgi:hypothetical protein